MSKPTNKQEALDQIDSLRAYIEDLDKPKLIKCEVYVKKTADDEWLEAGRIYNLDRTYDDEKFYYLSGEGTKKDNVKSVCVNAGHCVIVEGELPPNDTKE